MRLKLGVRTVGKYLARWGFTPAKSPSRRHTSSDPRRSRFGWKSTTRPSRQRPAAQRVAKFTGAMKPHWSNTDVRGRSYAPAGETPVVYTVGSTRQKLSMIATVTNRGKARWMIIDEAFNSDRLIEFLQSADQGRG